MKLFNVFIFISILFFSLTAQAKNSWYIDHVVIVVNRLDVAVKNFKQLGFVVIPGGKHGGNFDHNALIPLADGSYIELFAPLNPSMMSNLEQLKKQHRLTSVTKNLNAIDRRFIEHVASGEGLADFAISKQDLNIHHPIMMNRVDPNGQKILWKVSVPLLGKNGDELPFLIADITPRAWRVGGNGKNSQPNGVTGIASLTVIVPDISTAVSRYEALLNEKPIKESQTKAVFEFSNAQLILETNSNIHRYGPYQLALYTSKSRKIGALNARLTHGAKIELIP